MHGVLQFQKKLRIFQEQVSLLQDKGMKKKEIAQYLELHPPVFSSLMNNIINKTANLEGEEEEISLAIQKAFNGVNNISEYKIKRSIENYIEKLKEIETKQHTVNNDPVNRLLEFINNSPNKYLKSLNGIYHCFYISSSGYLVKKEPFMLKIEDNTKLMAYKGNNNSTYRYTGFGYISNKDILTIQLIEEDSLHPDHFLINFYIPPSPDFSSLRGISLSMSNNYMPISRKIILQKTELNMSYSKYHSLETTYYPPNTNQNEYAKIIDYLYKHNSHMECLPIPQQSFDEKDLQKELGIMEVFGMD